MTVRLEFAGVILDDGDPAGLFGSPVVCVVECSACRRETLGDMTLVHVTTGNSFA